MTTSIRSLMRLAPVIPVIVIDDLEQAVPLARALVEGGLPMLEVTLRTAVGLQAIERIAREVPEAVVGVGTVTRPDELHSAIDAGARFGVSPGLTPGLADAIRTSGLPFLPGCMTPSEVIAAMAWGFDALKLFPAQQAGGVGMLKALAGPFPDLLFCPTGGVTAANATEFLALSNVGCVGGSWVTPRDAVLAGHWGGIRALATQAAALRRGGQGTRPAGGRAS